VLRAHVNPPTDSRYLYLGAILVLLVVLELLPRVDTTPRLLAVVAVFVSAAAIANFGSVRSGSQFLQDWSRYVRAELGALELAGPETRSDFAPDPVRAPDITAGRYFAAVRQWGSPASSAEEITRAGEGEKQAADSVFLQALGVSARPGGAPARTAPPSVEATDKGGATIRGGCVRFAPSGPGAALDVSIPDPGLLVEGRGSARVQLRLRGFAAGFAEQPFASLSAGRHSVRVPVRAGVRWHARLTTAEPVTACSLEPR
jgi:hypothetical protein